jgi:hypothetical protein
VYVGGAEVLGVSECSDLAVLKLDEGELPYLGAGFVDAYAGCGESGNDLVVVAATPPAGSTCWCS